MSKERSHFTKQFSVGPWKLKASAYKTKQGDWKILSVGAVDYPITLLPFHVQQVAMSLVRGQSYATENQVKAALLDADQ